MTTLRFLGAAGTVTGSKFLLDHAGQRVLLDAGLFQGAKHLRLRNWERFPVPAADIDAVLLSHAHLDHSGYLPALVRQGFRGTIHASGPTRDLCRVLLLDAAHLLEEDARVANERGSSRHHPALPLYTGQDALRAISQIRAAPWNLDIDLGQDLQARFIPAGHLLGASSLALRFAGRTLVCSGDIGRQHDPLLPPPQGVDHADVLLVESTYGDRQHPDEDVLQALAQTIERVAARGGSLLFPSFAVGRAQMLILMLYRLRQAGRIPALPVFLDSPMAAEATRISLHHLDALRPEARDLAEACAEVTLIESVPASMQLVDMRKPRIVISASGMATGGRVLHHLQAMAPRAENGVVFPGFQVPGTRGDRMLRGEPEIKIFGQMVPVRCEVSHIEGLSGHADADELMAWMRRLGRPPKQTWIVHGEPEAAATLCQRVRHELRWSAEVARDGEEVEL